MKKSLMLIVLCLTALAVGAQSRLYLTVDNSKGDLALCADGRAANIFVSDKEPIAVRRAAQMLADDMERVTNVRPAITKRATRQNVVVATLGHNDYVDKLVAKGKLDVADIRGGWERFVIRTLGNELFIVGSDRRGTAYGVVTLSEAMGVSPWYWWADVPVKHREALFVTADYTSREPSVRYRGIFINDEDWGLKPWATNNYERELGDIGPRTYARVCELLIRLKANMLAPAMHSCTGAFYSHPGSKVVADSFGIVITTSHCEPLLLNNAAESEWKQERDGDWNYKTNRETIYRKWDDRLAEAAQYENIYTMAMRGVHDAGLRGNLPMEERVPLIEKVIADQRELLMKHKAVGEASSIPQIFVPYKETMDIYENGLRVPDDITLVWVDDNYGYMKRVSNPEEQKRSGRAGVYYHLSYLGAPHDYLWLNTTPPVLMYEELKKAYDTGADRYWLLNVGDIKPMELGMQTFFDMAWNFKDFDFTAANSHQAQWLASLFPCPGHCGNAAVYQTDCPENCGYAAVYQDILDTYYRLAWSRKPEFMGFEYQWDDKAHTGLKPTDFSFRHYDEAQRRLADYERISDIVERLAVSGSPADNTSADNAPAVSGSPADKASFFQLLQFPVQAAYQMNRKFLMAQLNQELAAEGRYAEANWAARQMEEAYDSIEALNRRYNEQLDGKWRGMMALSTSFTNTCQFYQKPEVVYTPGAGEKRVVLTPLPTMPQQGCYVVDLSRFSNKSYDARLIQGLGYDWQVVQLGSPTDSPALGGSTARVEYTLPAPKTTKNTDSIDVIIYTVPFWPLYVGKSNRIGASIDGSPVQVFENKFKEYDRTWKDQVMRNGIASRLRFAIDPSKPTFTLTLHGIDPGQMVQRVIIDWGGLQPSYIGPTNNK